MDVATPWFRIIWVFVALGECLGIVPAEEDRYLPMVLSNLVTLEARPDLAQVQTSTIPAHKDTVYREIMDLLETSRAIRILETGPTPCDVLAAKTGAELFPNVVFAAQE